MAAHGVPLQPGELNPATLAATHAMSVRALHQLCEGHGEGLAARVRRLRLEGARRQLQEGGPSTVAAIALRWGFADAAHFTRAYKERFGERPRDTVARAWSDRECLQQELTGARHPRAPRDVAPGDEPSTRTAR